MRLFFAFCQTSIWSKSMLVFFSVTHIQDLVDYLSSVAVLPGLTTEMLRNSPVTGLLEAAKP
ncbi:MAG: hypothetical protein DRQ02_03735 [Candidatus Latescibacterota bacterium]|nr:MAG: hypothetical protein DRQ02_03735 [Candidatus Latescibacterota bacterium]RKY74142.1 MAG: hypothetical protein DRQ24_00400 [Candidatus Latescibacterota bacterium]